MSQAPGDHACSTFLAAMQPCDEHGYRCPDITIQRQHGTGYYVFSYFHDGRQRMTFLNYCPWDGAPLRDHVSVDEPYTVATDPTRVPPAGTVTAE